MECDKAPNHSNHIGEEMEKHGKICSSRLVLVPGPLQGHLNPMLQLAAALHSKGFPITIAHSQLLTIDNNHSFDPPDFTFFPIPDGTSRNNVCPTVPLDITSTIVNSEIPLRERLREMTMTPDDAHIACVIYDPLMYIVEKVVHDLKIPSIVLDTCCAAMSVINADYHRFQEEGHIPVKASKAEETLPGYPPFRFKDKLMYGFKDNEAAKHIILKLTKPRATSAYILNTLPCIEQAYLSKLKQLRQPILVFPIGPLHKITKGYPSSTSLLKEDTDCITWLNKQEPKSVIYVSTGSLSIIDEKELVETAWGLAQSEQPFLWVIRPGSVAKSEDGVPLLPEGFKEVVQQMSCVVEWAPQKEVLAHPAVGGFWSHCGWNSTLECVCNGIPMICWLPMICWPRMADQRMNARYVSYVWKVGLELEEMERGEIAKTVRNLLVSKEGNEMKERALKLKMEIEAAVREGGSSYNSLNNLVELILSF